MAIALESPRQPDVLALIHELDAYQGALYPAESNHGIDVDALSQSHVLFAVARDAQGVAVGCGALVLNPDFGELKRMFVRPGARGQGLAKALLAWLETQAAARGCTRFMLETGIHQPEALGLYQRSGYARRGPFSGYADDPLSVFMDKRVHLVFVFGTLKEGFPNFHVNHGARVPGEFVTVQPYPLYLVGERCSPWMVDSAGEGFAVAGQVYLVGDTALALMDKLERVGEPDGYLRRPIEVRARAGAPADPLRAFAYLKPAGQLAAAGVREGPLPEYALDHAARYRSRG